MPKTLSTLGDMFATHHGTAERIAAIKPLHTGVRIKPSLTEEQWQSLKKYVIDSYDSISLSSFSVMRSTDTTFSFLAVSITRTP